MEKESKKERLVDFLRTQRLKVKPISGANMREVADPNEAVAFMFDVPTNDGSDTAVVVSIDDKNYLNMFFNSDAHESKKFTKILPEIKRFGVLNKLYFNGEDLDSVGDYMKKRDTDMKKKRDEIDILSEAYRALSPVRSAGDHVPTVKIVIEHNRRMSPDEQRFRSINRIFIENTVGERILAPVRETSLARVFARVIAEGDLPHGQRWNHVEQLCEEFAKIRDFVRATKNRIDESELVGLGHQHYQHLKETLQRLAAHRGYTQYFDNWQPTLTEDNDSSISLDEISEGADSRVVQAMPILYRLQKQQSHQRVQESMKKRGKKTQTVVAESRHVSSLESWADSVIYDRLLESIDNESVKKN